MRNWSIDKLMVANERRDSTLSVYTSDSQPFQVNSPLCRSLIYHSPPNPRAVADEGQQARSQPSRWGGGGSELGWVEHQARIQDFLKGGGEDIHKHHPPWTLSAWRHQFEKRPHSWTCTSTPPPLDIALWRHPHSKGGGVIGRSRFA